MYCNCGCGKITNISTRNDKINRRIKGEYNRYLPGHHVTKNHYKGSDKWVTQNQNKNICNCGCNEYIVVKTHHFWLGIPRYIHGHQTTT